MASPAVDLDAEADESQAMAALLQLMVKRSETTTNVNRGHYMAYTGSAT